jgi:cysteine desulfurase family protein
MPPARIYLDNAATSWPKAEAVYQAVDSYLRQNGAAAGRGAYSDAVAAERLVADCRRLIAQLIAAEDPDRIVFTLNGTDSLNTAIHGMLRAGDHVVTSVVEHNSVLRPLRFLKEKLGIEVDYVGCDGEGIVHPDDIRRAIRPNTRLIALVHASNVTGAIQPALEVGHIAAEQGAYYLLDAAQSLGHVPVDVNAFGVHLLAAPGHKGLGGPLGTGVLYIAPGVEQILQPLRQGGTGTRSDEDIQPEGLPERYESGNLNVPGIVGLRAGVADLLQTGVKALHAQETALTERLLAGLREITGLTLYGPSSAAGRVGVVSFNLAGYDPRELASLLDANFGIQVRAGIHCAPRMHAALGTSPAGTVRASLGRYSTQADVDALVAALGEVAS